MRDVLIVTLLVVVSFFVLGQLRIFVIAAYCRTKDLRSSTARAAKSPDAWPTVAIQLPIYREQEVLPRLLAGVTALDYPSGRLRVQVLDDSEDEQAALARDVVESYADGPVPVQYVRRGDRRGFKSGALNFGTRLLDADLVCVFDADFVPDRSFLTRTVPLLADEEVGAVHTRWRQRNATASPLMQLQTAILDSLFCFGSGIRQALGESTVYLGTSGVWRKRTVEALGGWREAPFTDDGIDLSFRAQLAGWSVVFVNDALSEADLPANYIAFKNQQRRWARGAFRLFLDYWRSAFKPPQGLGPRFLELSSLHLVLSTPAFLVAGLLTSAYVVAGFPRTTSWIVAEAGVAAALLVFPAAQEAMLSQRLLYDDWRRRCVRLLVSLPLALAASLSILAGFRDTLRRREPEFVRTPKLGAEGVIRSSGRLWHQAAARVAAAEIAFGALFAAAAVTAVLRGYGETYFLLFVLTGSFLVSGGRSWTELGAEAAGDRDRGRVRSRAGRRARCARAGRPHR
jgi:cellulose synthase/poly-beta-1,6-N-acetylglucosamine synthase-like glycosyltransferase